MNKGYWLGIFAMLVSVSGCMNAAVTGAQAAYGHHNLENSVDDHYIAMQIDRKLHWYNHQFDNDRINIYTFNHVVLLTGQVQNAVDRGQIEQAARETPRVNEVHNEIAVADNTGNLTHLHDAWITSKIKSQMVAQENIDPSQFKVITENGTVYLMGIVPPEQAELATDIASETSGVKAVVKVFSYIHISKQA